MFLTSGAMQLPDVESAVVPVVPEPHKTVKGAGDNFLMTSYPAHTPEYLKTTRHRGLIEFRM